MRLRAFANSVLAAGLVYGCAVDLAAADDALVIYSRGVDGLLVDEKDKALRDALHLLDERVAELRDELPGGEIPPPLMHMGPMIAQMLLSPMTMRLGVLDQPPADGPPFTLSLAIESPDQEAATSQAEMLLQMILGALGQPDAPQAAGQPGMREIDLDGATLLLGSGQAGGNPAVIAAINTREFGAPEFGDLGLPQGVDPAFVMTFDGEALQPLIQMGLQQAPPMERGMVEQQLEMFGLMGETPLKFSLAAGYSADLSHLVMRLDNYVNNPSYASMLVREPLTDAILKRIPADATYAQVGRMKMSAIADVMMAWMGSMPEEEIEDPFAMIEQEIGINPRTDLLDHLGDTWGVYMSDTTGGGGLLSSVMFLSVANETALRDTLDRFRAMVNEHGQAEARGYVKLQERTIAGHDMVTLSFPGLPIPLEISYALEGGWLTAAATPQALIGALAHARSGGRGLPSNERFASASGANLKNAIYLEFMDTPRLIAGGYGLTSLITSAVANAVQSPRGGREVGLLLPAYNDLAENAKPYMLVGYIDGETLVYEGTMDRSALVNVAASVGSMGGLGAVAVAAVGAGVLLPAIGQAREAAQATMSAAQLRQIHQAATVYEQENNEAASREALLEGGFITEELFNSPVGDQSEYWLDFEAMRTMDSNRIVGYDRSAYMMGTGTPTLFADGHVEVLEYWDFSERTQDEWNAEVDFDLPW